MCPQRFSMEGISSILHSGLRQTFGPAANEKQVPFYPFFPPKIAQICPFSPPPRTPPSPASTNPLFKSLFNFTTPLPPRRPANPPCQNPPFSPQKKKKQPQILPEQGFAFGWLSLHAIHSAPLPHPKKPCRLNATAGKIAGVLSLFFFWPQIRGDFRQSGAQKIGDLVPAGWGFGGVLGFFFLFFTQYLNTVIPYEKKGSPPSVEDLQMLTNSE